VSRDCALEMVRAALRRSGGQAAVATTGIAGPSGGTPAKPVGLTFIAWAGPGFEECQRYQFRCGRNRNRMLATHEALKGLVRRAEACNATSTK
jgi:nicotinamide-nucleotide amidase